MLIIVLEKQQKKFENDKELPNNSSLYTKTYINFR